MPDPIGLGQVRPPAYRPAATQPLDPAAVERVTQQLKTGDLAKTTTLDPLEQAPRLPGLLGAMQDFVQSMFGNGAKNATNSGASSTTAAGPVSSADTKSAIALPIDGGDSGRLTEAEPSVSAPAAVRDWSAMVSMDAAGPTPVKALGTDPATAQLPDAKEATRSWGLVSMDGAKAEEPSNGSAPAAPGMFRSWGMVSMAEEAKAPVTSPTDEPTQVFRSWGMVDMKEPTPPKVDPPPTTGGGTEVDPPPTTGGGTEVDPPPTSGGGTKVEPPATDPAKAAKLDKVAALVSPEVQQMIATLASEGKLDAKGPKGASVLDSLVYLADNKLGPMALSLGYTSKGVIEQTVRDMADPLSIQQQGENDCVWTNLRFAMSKDTPGEYAELAAELYVSGTAQLKGGGEVKLDDALKPFSLGGSVGNIWYKDGELWMQHKGFPPMPVENFVGDFFNNQEWIDRLLKENPLFDNPIVRAIADDVRDKWNEGKRQEVLEMAAPFVEFYINSQKKKSEKVVGMQYALDNLRSLFQPATQAAKAMPKGVALGGVDEFYPGLKGFYVDEKVLGYLDGAAQRGARVSVAFTTDDGKGLHMATIMGKASDTEYIVYDPENGARTMPASVLRERAVGAFLAPGLSEGLTAIPDTDERGVGGGRFSWRGVGG